MKKSVTSSNQTADRKTGTVYNTSNAPKNAGKEAANEKPPVPSSSATHGENAPPALPESLSIRISTVIPGSLVKKIEEAARQRGGNRSAVLTECLSIGLSALEALPDMPLPEADRLTLRRAFHLLLSKRRASIEIEEETLFQDAKNDKKKGVFTNEARADYMAEYGRLKEETSILSMLEKGVSPDSILNAQILTDGEVKPEWQSYLSMLADLYSMFATPEEMEA